MGYRVTEAVWRSALPAKLKPMAALVAHLVREKPQDDKPAMKLFAQVGALARRAGLHPKNVRRRLHELVEVGFLQVAELGGGRRRMGRKIVGVATVYTVHPERLPQHGLPNEAVSAPADTLTNPLGNDAPYPNESVRAIREIDLSEKNGNRKNVCKTAPTSSSHPAGDVPAFDDLSVFAVPERDKEKDLF